MPGSAHLAGTAAQGQSHPHRPVDWAKLVTDRDAMINRIFRL